MRTKPDGTLRSRLCKVAYNTYDLLKTGKTRKNELYSSLHHFMICIVQSTEPPADDDITNQRKGKLWPRPLK